MVATRRRYTVITERHSEITPGNFPGVSLWLSICSAYNIFRRYGVRGKSTDLFPVDRNVVEKRGGADVFVFARTDGVETETGENIPRRHGSVVLVAGETVVCGRKCFRYEFFYPIFRFFALSEKGVKIWNVKTRLVGDGALSEIDCRHFAHFMDLESVTAHAEDGRCGEQFVKSGFQFLFSAVKPGKSGNVVIHGKAVLPCRRRGRRFPCACLRRSFRA